MKENVRHIESNICLIPQLNKKKFTKKKQHKKQQL